MLKTIKILELISKNSVLLAETFLWIFVAFGVCRLFFYGVIGVSSAAIAICIIFTLIAYIFYLAAFACRIRDITKKHKGKTK